MREIKFRYWNGGERGNGRLEDVYSETNINTDGKLMQYTGLKDKNGKEIYEGDIIRRFQNGEHLRKGDVYYNSNYGKYEVMINNEVNFDLSNRDDREIIGNIWENPDLLSKK